jgi:uncharacterized protein YecE (DUF72 family)
MSDTATSRDRAEILVGTSGYSFADWVGPFYPPGTRPGDYLEFYARHFPVVEVNSTYYRIPEPRVLAQMERKTPDGFRFVVKLNQAFTHEHSRDPETARRFLAVLTPLKEAGKYEGLLLQFPWGFRRTPENRMHLAALRELFVEEPMWVEFRHDSWLTEGLERSLREHRIGYCAVDEPALPGLLPPVTMATTPDAYVRFHGRNAANWWGPRATGAAGGAETARGVGAGGEGSPRRGGDRYDWDYTRDELGSWMRRIAELAERSRRVYLFFNNCHAGQAARSAKLMQELLRQQGLLR